MCSKNKTVSVHHYAWLPRSSGIQYLQTHEFNFPLVASWVLHFTVHLQDKNASFSDGGSLSALWFLFIMYTFNLSAIRAISLYSHVNWIPYSYFILYFLYLSCIIKNLENVTSMFTVHISIIFDTENHELQSKYINTDTASSKVK